MQVEKMNVAVVQAVKAGEIAIYAGAEAWQMLAKEELGAEWDTLYQACPWATVFQSRPYVTTWYHIYRETCSPILVIQYEGKRLTGLLALTKNKKGVLTGAGESQAEYQVWLATAASGNEFIKKALCDINRHWPGARLLIKYIPGNTPMHWVEEANVLRQRCIVNIVQQPLLKIDDVHLTRELQKKNRKEKLNRLKRLGNVKLERVTDPAVFAAVLDELTCQYDFRKIVMHNRTFFQNDLLRKKFLLSLFEQGLLHTTLLTVNNEIVASNVGVADKQWVHLQGLNTHAPSYSRYSPGILHFLLMGKLMVEEEVTVFDLTPGSAAYKDQLATDYASAYVLQVGSQYSHFINYLKRKLVEQAKTVIQGGRAKPSAVQDSKRLVGRLKDKLRHLTRQSPSFLIKYVIANISRKNVEQWYVMEVDTPRLPNNKVEIKRNSIRDLLCYESKGAWRTKWEFLEDAMRRFEAGQILYSFCKEGCLLCCVWVTEPQSTNMHVLRDIYCQQLGQRWLSPFLSAVIQDIMLKRPIDKVYVQLQDGRFCQTLKVLGFKETNKPTFDISQ